MGSLTIGTGSIFLFGAKSANTIPTIAVTEKAICGTGSLNSAMIGLAIVENLATTLQIPKAVDVSITGNTIGVDKYAVLKAKAMPNFDSKTKTAMALSTLKKNVIQRPPRVATQYAIRKEYLIPITFITIPLVVLAVISERHETVVLT